ncbi:MAG: M1 family metallopeptidase [Acidobacteriota bacterium]
MYRVIPVLLLLPLGAAPVLAEPLPERSGRIVGYTMTVRLDPETRQLTGTQRLTWRNPSAEPVGDLWFHLYLNAFKNTKTTFFRESGGRLRGDQAAKDSWGWIDITSMKTEAGVDLTSRITFEQPDDGNEDDQTVARVVLPEPVEPGATVALDLTFTSKLPQVFARTGFKHDFYLVGQWFPKLGVYEPAGMRGRETGGWNCHQFHASSEFYADYGSYVVAITVPSSYRVSATGERTQERTNGDGTTTFTYVQDDVHDFAWTADPDYIVVKATFSATKDVTSAEYQQAASLLGRTLEEVMLSDVEITVMLQPDHAPQADRHVRSAKEGLKWFGLWYGKYPYRTLTVVDPQPGGGGAGGMEYPTFITAGTNVLFNRWPFDRIRGLEMVTIHEFGHQFWYGLVGNNEFEEAWLDEGINSYSTGRVIDVAYGRDRGMVEFLGLRIGEADILRAGNSPAAIYNRIIARAWDYTPPGAYGFYSYQKPELALRTLEGLLGEQTMARVMRTFHERWRFRHPRSDDFFDVASEVSGRDLSWYFDQVFRGTDVLDYAVGSVSSEPAPQPRGVFDGPDGRTTVSEQDARNAAREARRTGQQYETRVVVQRRGGVCFPVDVAFKFEGKPVERLTWDGRDRTRVFRFTRAERLEWVDVDPDRKVVLDVNWLNNGRRVEGDRRTRVAWTSRWLFFVQNLLASFGL